MQKKTANKYYEMYLDKARNELNSEAAYAIRPLGKWLSSKNAPELTEDQLVQLMAYAYRAYLIGSSQPIEY